MGIRTRISTELRFSSILKLQYVQTITTVPNFRFQDFHVKEIDVDGEVATLDSLVTRSDIALEFKQAQESIDSMYASLGPEFQFSPGFSGELSKLVSSEDLDTLTNFLRKPVSDVDPYCSLISTELNGDKDHRKSFHALIREHFGSILTTDTLEEGECRSIRVWIKKFHDAEQQKYKQESQGDNKRGGKRARGDRGNAGVSVGVMMKNPWPKDRPENLHFRLYKENRDTAEAIQSIARCLHIPPKSFSTCGTKDRRGVTVQSVSVYRVSIESMKRAIMHPSWDNAVRVSHFEYKPYPNRIGRSGGNHFTVCLRRISTDFPNESIDALFNQLKTNGFLNYYGLQRFGTRQVRTHQVGGLLMAQNWKGVVDALLSPEADACIQPGSAQATRTEWRQEYATGNIEKAFELCPPYMYIEKSLLRALHHSGQSSNYLNAIQSLPSSNVQLYLHAVQSLVFNMVLSERVKQHGLYVMVGDLVEVGEDVVVVETEEQAAQYSINDVALTLVGNSVKLSPLMEPFYEQSLQSLFGISVSDMRSKNVPAMIQLKGAYRKILATARNLSWTIHEAVSDSDILIRSDVDVLKNEQPKPVNTAHAAGAPYKAVVFECDLDSGVYLTMALREVTEASELAREQINNSSEPNSTETTDS